MYKLVANCPKLLESMISPFFSVDELEAVKSSGYFEMICFRPDILSVRFFPFSIKEYS